MYPLSLAVLVVTLLSPVYANHTSNLTLQSQKCPPGWVRFRSEKCFKLFVEKRAVKEAQNHCQQLGSNLAAIHSYAEHRFLMDYILREVKFHNLDYTLIGSKRIGKGNLFRWINFDLSPFNWFTWWPGYPTADVSRSCLALSTHRDDYVVSFKDYGKYFNVNCLDGYLPYICQITKGHGFAVKSHNNTTLILP